MVTTAKPNKRTSTIKACRWILQFFLGKILQAFQDRDWQQVQAYLWAANQIGEILKNQHEQSNRREKAG